MTYCINNTVSISSDPCPPVFMKEVEMQRQVFYVAVAWIAFSLAGCVVHERVLRVDESTCLGYSRQENEIARQAGFGIAIKVEDGDVYVPEDDMGGGWKMISMEELESRIENAVASSTSSALRRIPVSVCTFGNVRFRQVVKILDMCRGFGLRVLGMYTCMDRPAALQSDVIDLPCLENGETLDKGASYDNCISVCITRGGRIVVDGKVELDGNDLYEDREIFTGCLYDKFSSGFKCGKDSHGSELVCLLFADKDAPVEHVIHAAEVVGAYCPRMAVVGQGKSGCRFVVFTFVTPNCFFWNYESKWSSFSAEKKY